MELINKEQVTKKIGSRILKNSILKWLFLLATSFGLIVLAILIYRIFTQGFGYLNLDFFTNFASRRPADAGIKAAIFGTIWLMAVTGPVSIVLGVGCAIYLELYAKKNAFTRFIQMNISNLAGVPSIVFGLLGLTVFVRMMEMGRSVLAGGLTMSLVNIANHCSCFSRSPSCSSEGFTGSVIWHGCNEMANHSTCHFTCSDTRNFDRWNFSLITRSW